MLTRLQRWYETQLIIGCILHYINQHVVAILVANIRPYLTSFHNYCLWCAAGALNHTLCQCNNLQYGYYTCNIIDLSTSNIIIVLVIASHIFWNFPNIHGCLYRNFYYYLSCDFWFSLYREEKWNVDARKTVVLGIIHTFWKWYLLYQLICVLRTRPRIKQQSRGKESYLLMELAAINVSISS